MVAVPPLCTLPLQLYQAMREFVHVTIECRNQNFTFLPGPHVGQLSIHLCSIRIHRDCFNFVTSQKQLFRILFFECNATGERQPPISTNVTSQLAIHETDECVIGAWHQIFQWHSSKTTWNTYL